MSFHGKVPAAEYLADLRLRIGGDKPIDDLPAQFRPSGLMEAYEIQAHLRGLLAERSPGPPAGWKIGCTTRVMQDYLKIPHPCAGTLYRNRVHRSNATLAARDYMTLGLECEIAVELSRDLPMRDETYEREDMFEAIGGVMASIEIVEHRFADFRAVSIASLVADDFFSAGCVVGQPVPLEKAGDLETLRGGFAINRERPVETGRGAEILGHPMTALAWLADHVARLGTPLRAGDIVTLGSVVKTIYPEPGQLIEARFTRLPPARIEVI